MSSGGNTGRSALLKSPGGGMQALILKNPLAGKAPTIQKVECTPKACFFSLPTSKTLPRIKCENTAREAVPVCSPSTPRLGPEDRGCKSILGYTERNASLPQI